MCGLSIYSGVDFPTNETQYFVDSCSILLSTCLKHIGNGLL